MTFAAHQYNINIQSGTAQAGGANAITLASAASSTDGTYNGCVVSIGGGAGSGQSALITGYAGSTRIATVSTNWATVPDSTSVYTIYQWPTWANTLIVVSAERMDHIEADLATAGTEILRHEMSGDHDGRYYTQATSDGRYVQLGGSTLTGQLVAQDLLAGSGDVNHKVKITGAYSLYPDTSGYGSEISNDTGAYKTLMIVGNKSAGGSRKVDVWDVLNVNGSLTVNGTDVRSDAGFSTGSFSTSVQCPPSGHAVQIDQTIGGGGAYKNCILRCTSNGSWIFCTNVSGKWIADSTRVATYSSNGAYNVTMTNVYINGSTLHVDMVTNAPDTGNIWLTCSWNYLAW